MKEYGKIIAPSTVFKFCMDYSINRHYIEHRRLYNFMAICNLYTYFLGHSPNFGLFRILKFLKLLLLQFAVYSFTVLQLHPAPYQLCIQLATFSTVSSGFLGCGRKLAREWG